MEEAILRVEEWRQYELENHRVEALIRVEFKVGEKDQTPPDRWQGKTGNPRGQQAVQGAGRLRRGPDRC